MASEGEMGLNLTSFHWKYDKRFGTIQFQLQQGENKLLAFQVPIASMLEQIPSYEMRCYMDQAKEGPGQYQDIDEMRRVALQLTPVEGRVVLDVGGYMGEFAKMALDRGAARGIVLDTEQWRHYGQGTNQFEWEDKRHEGVEYVKGDLRDLFYEPEEGDNILLPLPIPVDKAIRLPCPDVLLLYNVLYHVKNPWAFLERAREIIKPDGDMLLCTLFRYHDGPWVYLYEPREANPTDESVFWGPSLEAVERLLTFTGWTYERVGYAFDRVVYRCKPNGTPQYRESRS